MLPATSRSTTEYKLAYKENSSHAYTSMNSNSHVVIVQGCCTTLQETDSKSLPKESGTTAHAHFVMLRSANAEQQPRETIKKRASLTKLSREHAKCRFRV